MTNFPPKNVSCVGRGIPQGHDSKFSRQSVTFMINPLSASVALI